MYVWVSASPSLLHESPHAYDNLLCIHPHDTYKNTVSGVYHKKKNWYITHPYLSRCLTNTCTLCYTLLPLPQFSIFISLKTKYQIVFKNIISKLSTTRPFDILRICIFCTRIQKLTLLRDIINLAYQYGDELVVVIP